MLPAKALNQLSRRIIGCAIAVHRQLGPGLLEGVYEEALCIEMDCNGLAYERQLPVKLTYRGKQLRTPLKLDLLVAAEVIVEVKAVEGILPVHEAQLLSYLRLAQKDLGLLINFHVPVLKEGIRRKIRYFPQPEKGGEVPPS